MQAYQAQANHSQQSREANGYASNAATNTAANGLFLLSQAHQELAKREAQAAAAANASANGNGSTNSGATTNGNAQAHTPTSSASVTNNNKRGTKRKAYDSPVNAPAELAPEPSSGKRTRSSTASTQRRGSVHSFDEEEEDDMDDMDELPMPTSQLKKGGAGQKKPETEEEKRRNFLERNRQGKHLSWPTVANGADGVH